MCNRNAFWSLLAGLLALVATGCAHTSSMESVSLEGFSDAIHYWYNRTDQRDAPLHDIRDTRAIADNILLYQRRNGGWPENTHPQRVLRPAERAALLAEKDRQDASFDNRNIYPQITYLSHAYAQTEDERYRDAALAGLEYTLAVQYENGGWPHSPGRPDRAYGAHVTFADEVMPGVLGFLREVAGGSEPFSFVPASVQARAQRAVKKGDQLVLDLQIRIDGTATIWAGQYHSRTLEPVAARSYELPALQTWESVAVVEYLMSIEKPSEAVAQSIHSAIDWFEANRIEGVRLEQFPIEPQRFEYHTATFDRRIVKDPEASTIWARFYDLNTSEPFFTNRDGSRVDSLAEVALERRSGYSWYGDWPLDLIRQAYPAWKEKHGF